MVDLLHGYSASARDAPPSLSAVLRDVIHTQMAYPYNHTLFLVLVYVIYNKSNKN